MMQVERGWQEFYGSRLFSKQQEEYLSGDWSRSSRRFADSPSGEHQVIHSFGEPGPLRAALSTPRHSFSSSFSSPRQGKAAQGKP